MARFTKSLARFRVSWGYVLALFLLAHSATAQVPLNTNREVNANTELNVWLQTPKMAPLQWFASTDKSGGNDDFVLLKPGETRRVALAAGELERLWATGLEVENLDLSLETAPNRSVPLLQHGNALIGALSGRAYTLYPSITFDAVRTLGKGATLVATNRSKTPNKWYYQASVRPDAPGPLPLLPQATAVDKRQFKLDLAPGAEQEIETWNAPGLIFELSVAVTDGSAKGVFQKLRLHADWDGTNGKGGARGVDAPLMSLGGQVAGEELIQNAVCDYDGARLLLRWPMPFRSARLSLQNQTDQQLKLDVMVRVQTFAEPPSDYRFCAVERTAQTKKGQPIEVLHTTGEGDFAGLALAIKTGPNSLRRQWSFLEGDETIVADGKKYEGTGTEDYFSSAWYWAHTGGLFVHPYEGLTDWDLKPSPHVAAYRLHLNDAIPFARSLDFKFEHGVSNNSSDGDFEWTWVPFWYQKLPLPAGLIPVATASPGASSGAAGVHPIFLALGGVVVLIGGIILIARPWRRVQAS